jgi:serine protease Do
MTARQLTITAIVLTLFAGPATAQRSRGSASKLLAPFHDVVAKANSATVRILCDDKDSALGTIVYSDGYILTKASELRGNVTVKLADGSIVPADMVSLHKPTDLALLKIDAKNLPTVNFTDSKKVPTGNWLAAAGPGSDPTAVGIVSVKTRDFGTPRAVDMLNNNRGFIGIILSEEDDTDGGARVDDISAGGGAAKAGIKKSDVIFEVNGHEVPGQAALRELLENYRPGDKLSLKVRRDGEELSFRVTLTGPPGPRSRSDIQNTMGGKLSGRRSGFPSYLQTDMIIDPEDCGGPVVDLDGKVLGINIARAGRVETWVLPSETIRPVLAEMKAGKYPPLAFKKVLMKDSEQK